MDEISATAGLYLPEICEDQFIEEFEIGVAENARKEETNVKRLPMSNWMVVSLPSQNKTSLKSDRVNSV